MSRIVSEIAEGIASTIAALGETRNLAPVLRFPGLRRTLGHLERKHKGVALTHDIQPVTARALPDLLRELKLRGYRIVHVVPAGPKRGPIAAPKGFALRQSVAIWARVTGAVPPAAAKDSQTPTEASPRPQPPTDPACGEPSHADQLDWCGREDSNLHEFPH
jgi:hypothetical protein